MKVVTFPDSVAFVQALQNPHVAFADELLKQCEPELNALGLPKPISGNFASVFRLRHATEGTWAVKCFTKLVEDRERRYEAISTALEQQAPHWSVSFSYVPNGVRVESRWWPIVKMRWLSASTLSRFVRDHVSRPDALFHVAEQLCALVNDLEVRGWSHGDLQHGNLLIDDEQRLVAIDYDGMFVPALRGLASVESGHRHYQPPNRSKLGFGPKMDRFSGWSIMISLIALARESSMYARFPDPDECLLFSEADYQQPKTSVALASLREFFGPRDPLVTAAERLVNKPDDTPALSLDGLALAEHRGTNAARTRNTQPARAGGRLPSWMEEQATAAPVPSKPASHNDGFDDRGRLIWTAPPIRTPRSIPSAPGQTALAWLPSSATTPAATPSAAMRPRLRRSRLAPVLAFSSSSAVAGALVYSEPLMAGGIGAGVLALVPLSLVASQRRRLAKASHRLRKDSRKELERVREERDSLRAAMQEHEASSSATYAHQTTRLASFRDADRAERERVATFLRSELSKLRVQSASLQQKHMTDVAALRERAENDAIAQSLASRRIRGNVRLNDECLHNLDKAGIRTAADFSGYRTLGSKYDSPRAELRLPSGRYVRVPQIGPKRAAELEAWRAAQERNAKAKVRSPNVDTTQLERKLAEDRLRIEADERILLNQLGNVLTMSTQAWRDHEALVVAIRESLAEADTKMTELQARFLESQRIVDTAEAQVQLAEGLHERQAFSVRQHLGAVFSPATIAATMAGAAAGAATVSQYFVR